MDVNDFAKMKRLKRPIKMITCYDYWTAKIIADTKVDCVLVGDSASMVMHGFSSTINADIDMMEVHIESVKRGINGKFIIGDMPFLSCRKSITETMSSVEKLMKAGAHSIKLEGLIGNEKVIKHIVDSGIPVMGHIGFTPQSVNMFGNKIVQGKNDKTTHQLLYSAKILEDLGCFAIVLECMPANLVKQITEKLSIPTIGIGAGPDTSGQVLVLQDLLGSDPEFNPLFLKKYLNIHELIKKAVNAYCIDVDEKKFPSNVYSYGGNK